MADWNVPAGESDNETPPIPDGGLSTSMPAWLKTPPVWATSSAGHTLPPSDHSPIDPASLVREEDVPQWMRTLSRHMNDRASAAEKAELPDLADTALNAESPPASGESDEPVPMLEGESAEPEIVPNEESNEAESEPVPEERAVTAEPAESGDQRTSFTGDDDESTGNSPEPSPGDRQGVLVDASWDPRAVPIEAEPIAPAEPVQSSDGPVIDYRPVVIRDQSPTIIESVPESGDAIGESANRTATPRPKHTWRDPVVMVLLILAAIVIVTTLYLVT